MQSVTPQFLNALNYSQQPIDRVDVWRGGALVASDLAIASGSVSTSGGNGQVVRTSVTLTVIDKDGSLVPNAPEDPLAPFGSELQIQMGLKIGTGTELLNQGFFPIVSTTIDEEHFPLVRPDEPDTTYWVSRGATLDIDATDRILNIESNKFIYREQPSKPDVWAEAGSLLSDNKPPFGGVMGWVGNAFIPSTVTYDLDRLKALLDLGEVINADCLVDCWGSFRFITRAETSPVWRLSAGQFSVLKSTKRQITRDGVYNGAVETGATVNDLPLRAVRIITTGPLAWGGPFGKVALQHASSLLDSQASVETGVVSVLKRASTITPQSIPIECIRNPALQWGDYIELPTRMGFIKARVIKLDFPFGVETMSMTVSADPFMLRGLL